MTNWNNIDDSEDWFEIDGRTLRHCCCNCGLIHEVTFKIKKNKINMKWEVNKRATGQRRRYLKNKIGSALIIE